MKILYVIGFLFAIFLDNDLVELAHCSSHDLYGYNHHSEKQSESEKSDTQEDETKVNYFSEEGHVLNFEKIHGFQTNCHHHFNLIAPHKEIQSPPPKLS